MQITAKSPNGGSATQTVELVIVPASPLSVIPAPSGAPLMKITPELSSGPQQPTAVSESDRFLGLPRTHGEKNPQPSPDEIPASLNAPTSIDSSAPAEEVTPPKPPDEH